VGSDEAVGELFEHDTSWTVGPDAHVGNDEAVGEVFEHDTNWTAGPST